jgi:hypothetical protein
MTTGRFMRDNYDYPDRRRKIASGRPHQRPARKRRRQR